MYKDFFNKVLNDCATELAVAHYIDSNLDNLDESLKKEPINSESYQKAFFIFEKEKLKYQIRKNNDAFLFEFENPEKDGIGFKESFIKKINNVYHSNYLVIEQKNKLGIFRAVVFPNEETVLIANFNIGIKLPIEANIISVYQSSSVDASYRIRILEYLFYKKEYAPEEIEMIQLKYDIAFNNK